MMNDFDVIIIGGGHAGCEAAAAVARIGLSAALFSIKIDDIATEPCNPAIGGSAKGQIVREIVALGGIMGRVTDSSSIHSRYLNTRKGPAVRATRVQTDSKIYHNVMLEILAQYPKITIIEGEVSDILIDKSYNKIKVKGVKTVDGKSYYSACVVVGTGTFLNGKIFTGRKSQPAGRFGIPPSKYLSNSLGEIGLSLGRLKTGTCARVHKDSINYFVMEQQPPLDPPLRFDQYYPSKVLPQVNCFITHTNEKTHEIIRSGINRSPLYQGDIKGIGPRYCPSIEDKVVKFPHRTRHTIFIEPEGLDTPQTYLNGLSTSLPEDIQIDFLHSIEGLQKAEIIRFGYAIEYDFVQPTQLYPTLETKKVEGLYLAGQINGTSGYEEAAAQGLVAGANSALKILNIPQLIIKRHQGYIGVLIDDLVTKGVTEPYRMLSSRAECRLVLREDNAEERLVETGSNALLVDKTMLERVKERKDKIKEVITYLNNKIIIPNQFNAGIIEKLETSSLKKPVSLSEFLKRPEIVFDDLCLFDSELSKLPLEVKGQVEMEIKFAGYVKRQETQIKNLQKLEDLRIPNDFDYNLVSGLGREAKDRLIAVKPATIGQAGRISGVTPAAISLIIITLKRIANFSQSV